MRLYAPKQRLKFDLYQALAKTRLRPPPGQLSFLSVERNCGSGPGGGPPGCLHPDACPLSQVREGASVRIKSFNASEDVVHRLRELGLLEEQRIQLLAHNSTVICRVCNVRMGLSPELAEKIMVEPATRAERPKKKK